jgi:hypothetical protein
VRAAAPTRRPVSAHRDPVAAAVAISAAHLERSRDGAHALRRVAPWNRARCPRPHLRKVGQPRRPRAARPAPPAPACSRLLPSAPACSRLLQPAPVCSSLLRLLRPASGCSGLLRPASGLPPACSGCSGLLRPASGLLWPASGLSSHRRRMAPASLGEWSGSHRLSPGS